MSATAETTAALPPLHDGLVDDAFRDRWLADLATHTEVLEVRVKGGAETYAPSHRYALDRAATMLRAGVVRGMQVRYRYDGTTWCDTAITAGPGRTRIVRIDESTITAGELAMVGPTR